MIQVTLLTQDDCRLSDRKLRRTFDARTDMFTQSDEDSSHHAESTASASTTRTGSSGETAGPATASRLRIHWDHSHLRSIY